MFIGYLPHFCAAAQILRKARTLLPKTAKVDDLASLFNFHGVHHSEEYEHCCK
jgi:hypothetical protein